MTTLTNRLVAAVLTGSAEPVDPGLVPTVVATACADVLDVDGAGLSLIGNLRVPLAASNSDARSAEQLQTTLGEGPCLSAVATGEALAADPAQMMGCWPVFGSELTRQTAFRSIVALPLVAPGAQPFGALDLYFTSPKPDRSLLQGRTRAEVVRVVASFLTGAPLSRLLTDAEAVPAPAAGAGGVVAKRLNVWTAIGVLMGATGLGQPEALAILRGHAFSHGSTLDEVADLITSRRLEVHELVG